MAHKGLRGRRKATKSTLKEGLRADKEKKEKSKKAKQENPTAGLRKWEKKALRAQEKAQEEAEIVDARKKKKPLRAKLKADTAGSVAPQGEKRKLQQVEADASVPSGPGKKQALKEARLKRIQERQHRALYSSGERILLVGEGNFSFARALCEQLGSGEGVYATAYDTEASIKRKYADAAEMRKEIEDKFGGTTLVGVDATRLHKVKEFRRAFKTIVWNFPHMGSGEKDVEKNIEKHRELLASFFKSAVQCLDPEQTCSIHVALKHGEPYKSWRIVQVAKVVETLSLQTVIPFAISAWPGYAHRRTVGFEERFSKRDSEELAKGAKVYIFTQGQERSGDEDADDA
eukprot:TRINITY_DN85563_c0_g1_i1.p1 TRINITY_DN85563_c0_g1~~TRINITY_DN85563_c0_g1_i1.p1  ORF type:complete len:356 (+),score=114.87 TRINITY_DN85563_c0_g1_i1:35-1069(+)